MPTATTKTALIVVASELGAGWKTEIATDGEATGSGTALCGSVTCVTVAVSRGRGMVR